MDPNQILSCGVDRVEFDTAYNNLPFELKNVIYNVAQRLWTADVLRYQNRFYED